MLYVYMIIYIAYIYIYDINIQYYCISDIYIVTLSHQDHQGATDHQSRHGLAQKRLQQQELGRVPLAMLVERLVILLGGKGAQEIPGNPWETKRGNEHNYRKWQV